MAMHDQTPVQVAWVTRDIDGTGHAQTSMPGATKLAVSSFDYVKQEQA
jgi:hypothetical protein